MDVSVIRRDNVRGEETFFSSLEESAIAGGGERENIQNKKERSISTERNRRARAVGINHVALEVDDVEAALAFYGELFELRLRGRHGGLAFIDLGDQFINLSPRRSPRPDGARHFGLVVDDRGKVRSTLERLGATILEGPGLDFLDPWENHVQVVQYRDVQFTKAEPVLQGMGLAPETLAKTPGALEELSAKGLAPDKPDGC